MTKSRVHGLVSGKKQFQTMHIIASVSQIKIVFFFFENLAFLFLLSRFAFYRRSISTSGFCVSETKICPISKSNQVLNSNNCFVWISKSYRWDFQLSMDKSVRGDKVWCTDRNQFLRKNAVILIIYDLFDLYSLMHTKWTLRHYAVFLAI